MSLLTSKFAQNIINLCEILVEVFVIILVSTTKHDGTNVVGHTVLCQCVDVCWTPFQVFQSLEKTRFPLQTDIYNPNVTSLSCKNRTKITFLAFSEKRPEI